MPFSDVLYIKPKICVFITKLVIDQRVNCAWHFCQGLHNVSATSYSSISNGDPTSLGLSYLKSLNSW